MTYFPAGSMEDEIITQKINRHQKNQTNRNPKICKKNNLPIKEKSSFLNKILIKNNKNLSEKEILASQKKMFNPRLKVFKKVLGVLILILICVASLIFYRAKNVLSRITHNDGSIFGGFFKSKDDLKGMQEEKQINLLLIGMRGQNIPGGSLLADTIILVMARPEENKIALISIPRDLYVEIPEKNYSRKINEANVIGEGEGKGKGLELMKKTVENITGVPIHYAVSSNFVALRDTVDILGGISVYLDKPFYEGKQFVEGKECGGEFSLPAGNIQLNGEKALCYCRARYATSDFDRGKRQRQVLIAIKDKALNLGTLSNFNKINDILETIGDNVRTDMQPWEIQKLFEIFSEIEKPQIYQRGFDTSKEGLLYSKSNGSYILRPVGDNYDQMRKVCQEIFANDPNKQQGSEEDRNPGENKEDKGDDTEKTQEEN